MQWANRSNPEPVLAGHATQTGKEGNRKANRCGCGEGMSEEANALL